VNIRRSKVVVVVNALFLSKGRRSNRGERDAGNPDIYACCSSRPESSSHLHLVGLVGRIVCPLDVTPPIFDDTQTNGGFGEFLAVRFFLKEADSKKN
jgi:hypothetical protein